MSNWNFEKDTEHFDKFCVDVATLGVNVVIKTSVWAGIYTTAKGLCEKQYGNRRLIPNRFTKLGLAIGSAVIADKLTKDITIHTHKEEKDGEEKSA